MKIGLGTVLSVATVIVSVAVTFGIQMERLAQLQSSVAELKAQVQQVMMAVGEIEHSRWRERRP